MYGLFVKKVISNYLGKDVFKYETKFIKGTNHFVLCDCAYIYNFLTFYFCFLNSIQTRYGYG